MIPYYNYSVPPVNETPPIVDDRGMDIYKNVPPEQQEYIRENIKTFLDSVARDYLPSEEEQNA